MSTLNGMFAETGYERKTTFDMDFDIADRIGNSAIKDTFNRAFKEWKYNVVYLTELVIILNWKIGQWYERNEIRAELYYDLWNKASDYAEKNLKGKELDYYYRTID